MADPLIITVALAGTPEAATADFVCDGSDDQIEIQAALDLAGAAGGGIVRLAAGDYSLSRPLAIYEDNVSIEGDPSGVTALLPDPFTWLSSITPEGGEVTAVVNFIGVDNFAARFLTIEYTPEPSVVPPRLFNGIQAMPTGVAGAGDICTNGVFEGNTIRLADAHTYSIWSLRAEGMQIIDNVIEGGATLTDANSSQEGIEIYGGRDVVISGNTITGMGNAAIQIGGLAASTPDCSVDNVLVTGNYIADSRVGVFIGTTWGAIGGAADATNITVEHNEFDGLYEAGLMIRNWTGNPADPPELGNIVFSENVVNLLATATGPTPTGVWLLDISGAGGSVSHDILIGNNQFTTSLVAAVPPSFWLTPAYQVLMLVQDFEGASFVGNTITMAASSTASRAFVVTGSSGIAITGNEISGAGQVPVEFYQSQNFIIDANMLADWGRGMGVPGILVGEATNYSIIGNTLAGPAGSDANFIALYASGSATSLADNIRVSDADSSLVGSLFQNLQLTGNAINGTGNELGNHIQGNAQANVLDGGVGADLLDGGSGNDRLIGGIGDDRFVVDSAGDIVVELAGEGVDQVTASIDYVLGDHVERLALVGTAIGGTGNAADNLIVGNELDNLLDGGAGADQLVGGRGDDHYRVDNLSDLVSELDGEGDDLVTSSVDYQIGAFVERLTITGTATIAVGNDLANIVTGNDLANLLDGGAGDDRLIGGLGNDHYLVDSALDIVVELDGEGDDLVTASVDYALGDHVERLILAGAALAGIGNGAANIITGNALGNLLDGGGGDDWLDGGLGDDQLKGGAGNDRYLVDSAFDHVVELDGEGDDLVMAGVDYQLGAHVETLILTGTALAGRGNAQNNLIVGNELANLLEGGEGDDRLDGGLGADDMRGGAGDDLYYVDDALDLVTELDGEGDDLVVSSVNYALGAYLERLTLNGAALNGTGNELANVITGNSLANRLDGGVGADRLAGGLGNDDYVVDESGDVVLELVGEGDDLVFSSIDYQLTDHVERLVLTGAAVIGTGNALANAITGNALANVLDGGEGNDLLDGGAGADLMTGGLGDDWFIVDQADDQVFELANGGLDTVFARASYTLAAAAKIERLYAEDPNGSAALVLIGNRDANEIRGNAGSNILHGAGGAGDVLIGLGGNDTYYTDVAGTLIVEAVGGGNDALYTSVSYALAGGQEVETLSTNSHAATDAINLTGNGFNQTLVGNAGNNILHGGGGTDVLIGFGGNDTYYTDVATTTVQEAADGGTDALYTSVSYVLARGVSVETLSTNSHAATTAINLTGNNLDQTLIGNAGNNILHGGGGDDILAGMGGNDTYYTDYAGTQVIEADGGGTDALYVSLSYVLASDASVEILSTNLTSGTAAINLTGSRFTNIVAGNQGANVLDGRGGADQLYGYGGADIFQFTSALGDGNVDLIGDFQKGVDRIALDDAVFAGIGGLGQLSASAFSTGSSAANASVRIFYNNATGGLFYDADGSGTAAAIQFASLGTGHNLAASDFMVI